MTAALNNIDKALAREVDHRVHPDRFLGDDDDPDNIDSENVENVMDEADEPEATEDEPEVVGHQPVRTVRTSVTHPFAVAIMAEMPQTIPVGLGWGAMTGRYLPEAHAKGEELRRQRRQDRPPIVETEPPAPLPAPVAQCDQWKHARDCEHRRASEDSGYYEALAAACAGLKGGKPIESGPDEWRVIPGSDGKYVMHGHTREVWRNAYTVDLPNGSQRRYEAKVLTPRNGSYSLSIGGKNVSRGVNALWAEVFAERASKRRKPGTWDDTITPKSDPYMANGVGEWLAGGGVDIA